MLNRILVVAAHPDDEVLGCGATIAKHVHTGDEVFVLIMGEGLTSRIIKAKISGSEQKLFKKRKALIQSARNANKLLGVSAVEFGMFPDNRLDSLDRLELIKFVEEVINKYSPDIVYTHYWNDVNVDHRITSDIVVTACRPQPSCLVRRILFFETISSTEWQCAAHFNFYPNWFIDVSDTLHYKIQAFRFYTSEAREWPHVRNIDTLEYLARWRGSMVGMYAAEAFMLGREIQTLR